MDRISIMNLMRYSTGGAIHIVTTTDDVYNAVERTLRATFVSSKVTLQVASKEDDMLWGGFLTACTKGGKEVTINFKFEYGWEILTAARNAHLVNHSSLTIVKFDIVNAKCGIKFMEALI